ncbi:MAG TPA: N4-gp56 family major capsid protein, partial [Symbiobacteriaceae bacterium]|nr:N4-gp56 family major capsid protein [Symbiobacteriaceae bacterium]
MAITTTGTAGISAEFPAAFYDRTTLERLLPSYFHAKFGFPAPLPKGNGSTIQKRRWERMSAKTTALTEGVVPAESSFSITGITATIQEYGDYVKFSDLVEWTGLDPVLTELSELLGEAAGDSIDQIVRATITAGTNVIYANGAARNAVNTAFSSTMARKARRFLKGNNAKPYDKAGYAAIVHTDVSYDIQGDGKWELLGQYRNDADNSIEDGEIGRLYGVVFNESTNALIVANGGGAMGTMKSTGGVNADVYVTVVVGKDAYMTVDLEGEGSKAVKTIFKPKGSA